MDHSDQIQHFAERIETPIIECEIKIIHEDEKFVNRMYHLIANC